MRFLEISYLDTYYQSMCELRNDVLRKPIGLIFTDAEKERDKDDSLFVCLENNNVIACCILTRKSDERVQLRQMAVAAQLQGKGIGKKMMQYAEETALAKGFSEIFMHARKSALGFYLSNGYRIEGEEFTEVGIPHLLMHKNIIT